MRGRPISRKDHFKYLGEKTPPNLFDVIGSTRPLSLCTTRTQTLWAAACTREPLGVVQGIYGLTLSITSWANILPGSLESVSFHLWRAKIQRDAAQNISKPPATVINIRGGNAFFSGTTAASRTLTLGVSLASCTFASSYC